MLGGTAFERENLISDLIQHFKSTNQLPWLFASDSGVGAFWLSFKNFIQCADASIRIVAGTAQIMRTIVTIIRTICGQSGRTQDDRICQRTDRTDHYSRAVLDRILDRILDRTGR